LDALAGSSVLVTGAGGFIGSHLVERLVRGGMRVRALAAYNSRGSVGWLTDLPDEVLGEVDVRLGDIRDAGFVSDLVDRQDIVFHLAALIAIPYSYLAPRAFVETNVLGTQNVLDAVRHRGCRLIHTSTSEVYGTPDELPITESHPLIGQSPYAASKIGADKLAEAYARSFATNVATIRPFNTFGPRQSLRAVIPTVLAQLLAKTDHLHLGSLSPHRDFTFVSDTVEGFVLAAEAELEPGEVVQLGSGRSISIGELVELCQEVVGHEARVTTDERRVRPAGSEVAALLSEPRLAAERLGWHARVGLEEGLRETASWLARRGISGSEARLYHR
jgi:NAD dependent epimerase/dehydratase